MDQNEIDSADQNREDILVVDDNPASLQLLKDILNKAGYDRRLMALLLCVLWSINRRI